MVANDIDNWILITDPEQLRKSPEILRNFLIPSNHAGTGEPCWAVITGYISDYGEILFQFNDGSTGWYYTDAVWYSLVPALPDNL